MIKLSGEFAKKRFEKSLQTKKKIEQDENLRRMGSFENEFGMWIAFYENVSHILFSSFEKKEGAEKWLEVRDYIDNYWKQ